RLVPVRPLEDAGLPLEPAAVRLRDVLAARGEHVEDEAPARREQAARGAEGAQLLALVGHVQQGTKRADHERHALAHRRPAQVADAEVEAAGDASRATSSIPGDASTPITSIPASATGTAMRPVPTASSTTGPPEASASST